MADIGAMLREARMREHLDIAEFEARTKIRAKYLRALEDEEWSLLPGYTFTKSFLRTYADMLGLDGRTLVDEFKRQFPDPSEIELSPSPPSRRDSRRSRERPGERGSRQKGPSGPSGRMLLIALLVVLVAAAVFVVRELDKKKGKQTTTTGSTTPATGSTKPGTGATSPAAGSAGSKRIALRLTAVTPVRVCLIGYVTAHGVVHQRLPAKGSATPTALLTPGGHAPTYHDDHFRVSFSGGRAHMLIGSKTTTVDATASTRSYSIGHSGPHLLSASQAPHCQ